MISIFIKYGATQKPYKCTEGEQFQSLCCNAEGCLMYNGSELTGCIAQEHEGILAYYIGKVRGGAFEIYARTMTGQNATIEVEEDETISSVIKKIEAKTKMANLDVYFAGKKLEPSSTVKENEISSQAVLMLVTSLL